jgi:hypothetical protein
MNAFANLQDYTALLQIAHHIPGRIRLKLKAAEERPEAGQKLGYETERFGKALTALPGIRRIQFNRLARSCTVEYDNRTIPDQAWPDLLANIPSPEALALLESLHASVTGAASSPSAP